MKGRRFLFGSLRVTALLAVCALVLGFLDYRAARASVMERLMGITQRMAPYLDDGRSTEAPRQVQINGVKLYVAAGHTPHPPSSVKRWYLDRYAAKGDGLDMVGAELKKRGAMLPTTPALNEAVFGNEQRGAVGALDFGDKLSVSGLRDRLKRFVGHGQLGEIARLRWVWFEPGSGGVGTRFLTVWTDESFRLENLMPTAKKDAEGSDIAGVPRFPGAVRSLSAEERGMPQKLVVYDGPGSPRVNELFYRARMETLGWQEDDALAKMAARDGRIAMKWHNTAGREVMIELSDAGTTGGTTAVVIQLH